MYYKPYLSARNIIHLCWESKKTRKKFRKLAPAKMVIERMNIRIIAVTRAGARARGRERLTSERTIDRVMQT